MAPLSGVRVLDLSRLLPGPFCSLILADLGADIIKLEDPGAGDYLRHWAIDGHVPGGSFAALNRGKRNIVIDLKSDAGRDLVLGALEQIDVVLESFRPGVMHRLGLGYQALRAQNPKIVMCSISGFGQTGVARERPGHDIGYQSLAGTLALTGEDPKRPATPGIQLADLSGGLWATIRILAALKSGASEHIDISMTETSLSLLTHTLGDLAASGQRPERGGGMLRGANPAYRTYATSDGGAVSVGALEPKFRSALDALLRAQASEPGQELPGDSAFASQSRDQWQTLADQNPEACIEPVLELDQLAQHPVHRSRDAFFTLEDDSLGSLELPKLPTGRPPADSPAAPRGHHTREVLREWGLTDAAIDDLLAQGAAGTRGKVI